MYPLIEESLSLREIACHWARDLPQRPPEREVLSTLLQAFWRGEFEPFASTPEQRFTRRQALVAVRDTQPHSGIAFRDDTAGDADEAAPTPEGDLSVDLRVWLNLPSDESCWNASVLEQAYERLTTCGSDAYSDRALIGFRLQRLERERFGQYCDRNGWPRPTFWFGQHRSEETVEIVEMPLRPLSPPGQKGPGAPRKHNYSRIDAELEKLFRKKGHQGFPPTAEVIQRLAKELGTDNLPNDSTLRSHIARWKKRQGIS